MIQSKYYVEAYKILPLRVNADLTQCSLEQALLELKFKLGSKYILHVGREAIREIINLTGGLQVFNILLEIDEDLEEDWYLVDTENKIIIYSPGA